MTVLRQVLNFFEDAGASLTVNQVARELDIAPGMLEGMIDHWVRKGKLRQTSNTMHCATCGGASGCPFVMAMPRSYELATGDDDSRTTPPTSCMCCR
jgi:hypothetical protein